MNSYRALAIQGAGVGVSGAIAANTAELNTQAFLIDPDKKNSQALAATIDSAYGRHGPAFIE